jgi:NADH-quinone oxidoreductase subunit L
MIAFGTAMFGLLLACCFYWWRVLNPEEVRSMFAPIYRFLRNKWWFDELYEIVFIRPAFFAAAAWRGSINMVSTG